MNLEPILAIWGGLYLDGEIISEADLGPYVDDVLNELEFLLVYSVIHISRKSFFLIYFRVHQRHLGAALELRWVTQILLQSTTSKLATKISSTAVFLAMSVGLRICTFVEMCE